LTSFFVFTKLSWFNGIVILFATLSLEYHTPSNFVIEFSCIQPDTHNAHGFVSERGIPRSIFQAVLFFSEFHFSGVYAIFKRTQDPNIDTQYDLLRFVVNSDRISMPGAIEN
jgi:hypothetical protein